MSKLEDVTKVVAGKTAALYTSGNQTQIAVFEALMLEKAIARGDSPAEALGLIDALRRMGAGLNEEEQANAHSRDRTVELKAIEASIEQNLAVSGQTPEQRAMTLGVLKNIGALMAGGGVSQGPNDIITPVNVPDARTKDTPLPDH